MSRNLQVPAQPRETEIFHSGIMTVSNPEQEDLSTRGRPALSARRRGRSAGNASALLSMM